MLSSLLIIHYNKDAESDSSYGHWHHRKAPLPDKRLVLKLYRKRLARLKESQGERE